LQFYHNPNFLRDCPHLIEKMKRRIRIKTTAHQTASLVPDFKNKQFNSELGTTKNYN
ncbi:heat shock transcription factor, Y-linked-like, partial [Sigmodon hispidus]